jgi:HK97 family phage portal protein
MAITAGWLRNFFAWGVGNREKGQQRSDSGSRYNESNVALTDQRALEAPVVFSCIRLLSELIGTVSLGTYKRTKTGREPAEDHAVAQLLREPNPFMTGQQLIETLAAQVCGWGNGYDLVDRTDDGRPVQLWPLLPSEMTVHREEYERLTYKYNTSRGTRELKQSQVLHVKGFGTDGIMGLSPLGYARQALGIQIAAEQYAAAFYSSGGRPSGVLQVDKPLTPTQRKELKENYGPIIGGSGGENGLWILDAFAKYTAISISPEDAQMLATRQFSVEEIARIFRVPLSLLMHGGKDSNWGTGLEQQNLAFLTYTLRPYLVRIETAINRWLFNESERKKFYVEFNVESLLRGDSAARAEFYNKALFSGWMNRDEVRERENLPPIDDGGKLFTVQAGMLPLDKLGAEPPPPPKAVNEPKTVDGPNGQQVIVMSSDQKTLEQVRDGHVVLAGAMERLAHGMELVGQGVKTVAAGNAAHTAAMADLAKKIDRPRKAILDKNGEPIGTVPVDSLEP